MYSWKENINILSRNPRILPVLFLGAETETLPKLLLLFLTREKWKLVYYKYWDYENFTDRKFSIR